MKISVLGVMIATLLLIAASTAVVNASTKLYTIKKYGNITIAELNLAKFKYIRGNYWLLTLDYNPSVLYTDIAKELREIRMNNGKLLFKIFIQPFPRKGPLSAWIAGPRNETFIFTVLDLKVKPLREIRDILWYSGVPGATIAFFDDNIIEINVSISDKYDRDKLLEGLTRLAKNYKFIVIEKMGTYWSIHPSDVGMVREMIKPGIPCFKNLTKAPLGIVIWIDSECAKEWGKNYEEALKNVLEITLNEINNTLRPMIYEQAMAIILAPEKPTKAYIGASTSSGNSSALGIPLALGAFATAVIIIAILARKYR